MVGSEAHRRVDEADFPRADHPGGTCERVMEDSGQQEEKKGDPVCWAQMPTEVRGAWSGLVWKLQKRSWGDVQRWDSEVPVAICLLESCCRGRWGWRGRPPGSGLPQWQAEDLRLPPESKVCVRGEGSGHRRV